MRLRVLLLVLALAGCGSHAAQGPVEASQRPLPPPLPTQPDPLLTPGDVIEGCTASTIGDRNATANEKRGLRVLYGLSETESNVVIDHLVPHALCGADTPNNLWPEEKTSSYAKDTVERHVINLVRAGRLSLAQGQQCFIVDWHTCPTTESTMIFIERPHFVDAVKYTGDNIDEVRSAAMLAGVEIREPTNPSLNHMASSIAVMQPSGTWAYLFPGMWLVRDMRGLDVLDEAIFRRTFCTPAEAAEMGPEVLAS